jgi:transcriptional regulator with XRE-family HTH domain
MKRKPTPLVEYIAAFVRERRKRQRLTLRDLAARTDRSVTFLSELENAKQEPGAASIVRLCRALGVSADALLGIGKEYDP